MFKFFLLFHNNKVPAEQKNIVHDGGSSEDLKGALQSSLTEMKTVGFVYMRRFSLKYSVALRFC